MGAVRLSSFADVDSALRLIQQDLADGLHEVLTAIGRLTAEVSSLQRSHDEMRRLFIEQSHILPAVRAPYDTGSFNLVEAWGELKSAAKDKRNPMTSERARAIVQETVERMRVASEASTWRQVRAFPAWAARKAAERAIEWLIPLSLGALAVELWRLLHNK